MAVHILDMARPGLHALCDADTPFKVTPDLHRLDVRGVDCPTCLALDDTARILAMAGHPSHSTASLSDLEGK